MKNIFAELSNLDEHNQEKLKNWLQQYDAVSKIDMFFEKNQELMCDKTCNEDINMLISLHKENNVAPAPGQIRALDTSLTMIQEGMRTVLVLSQWENNYWLVAPFSKYTFPAVPGEISIDADFKNYSVVESWNALVVPDFFLSKKTQYLRDVSEQIRKDACEVFFHELTDMEISEGIKNRIGPEIKSEFDVRVQYLLDEKQEFEPFRISVKKVIEFLNSLKVQKNEVIAAKDKTSSSRKYIVDELELIIKSISSGNEFRLQVYTKDEENYSNELDSWSIVSINGVILGSIVDGRSCIQNISEEAFCLMSPDGELVKVQLL